jgi:Protein of unknown function (DUF2842)
MTQGFFQSMTQSRRKFLGVIAVLVLIVVWAGVATAIYDRLLVGLPGWALILFFLVAGLGWGFPAAWIIRWMARPDRA